MIAKIRSALASDTRIAALLGAVALPLYVAPAIGDPTVFDYFGRLAVAITFGRVWLDGAPPQLYELVEVGGHLYHEVPPLIALLLVPFTAFGSPAQIQTVASAIIGALSAVPMYLSLRALGIPRALSVWCTVLSVFGTTLWISAVDGRSWFAADAAAVLFGSTALWLAASGRSYLLVGAALGVGVLARTPLVLAAPGLLLLARRDGEPFRDLVQRSALLVAGGLPFALIQAGYNVLRFGDPLQMGYGIRPDPNLSRGIFSVDFIPRHIYAIFFEPPFFADEPPFYFRARSFGMGLLTSTPALLWLAKTVTEARHARHVGPLALSAILVFVPNLLFVTTGYEQYGYRRVLDAQAFLIPLLAYGAGWTRAGWKDAGSTLFRVAVVISVCVTLYFLVEIRLFDFVPGRQIY